MDDFVYQKDNPFYQPNHQQPIYEFANVPERIHHLGMDTGGHSISTLVHEKELPIGLADVFSQDFLVKCVTGGGYWDANLLDIHLGESTYCFVKHRKAAVENWKQRLYNAMLNLALMSGKSCFFSVSNFILRLQYVFSLMMR